MPVLDANDPAVKLSMALNLVWGGAERVRPFFVETRRAVLDKVKDAVSKVAASGDAEGLVDRVLKAIDDVRAEMVARGEA